MMKIALLAALLGYLLNVSDVEAKAVKREQRVVEYSSYDNSLSEPALYKRAAFGANFGRGFNSGVNIPGYDVSSVKLPTGGASVVTSKGFQKGSSTHDKGSASSLIGHGIRHETEQHDRGAENHDDTFSESVAKDANGGVQLQRDGTSKGNSISDKGAKSFLQTDGPDGSKIEATDQHDNQAEDHDNKNSMSLISAGNGGPAAISESFTAKGNSVSDKGVNALFQQDGPDGPVVKTQEQHDILAENHDEGGERSAAFEG